MSTKYRIVLSNIDNGINIGYTASLPRRSPIGPPPPGSDIVHTIYQNYWDNDADLNLSIDLLTIEDDDPKVYSFIVEGTNGLNSPFDFEYSLFRIPLAADGNETAPQQTDSFMLTSSGLRSSGNPVATTSPYKVFQATYWVYPGTLYQNSSLECRVFRIESEIRLGVSKSIADLYSNDSISAWITDGSDGQPVSFNVGSLLQPGITNIDILGIQKGTQIGNTYESWGPANLAYSIGYPNGPGFDMFRSVQFADTAGAQTPLYTQTFISL